MQGHVTDHQRQLSVALKRRAAEEGFNPVGIARTEVHGCSCVPTPAALVDHGHQADMAWMAAPRRRDPRLLLNGPTACSPLASTTTSRSIFPRLLKVARYGWGRDYTGLWINDQDESVVGFRNSDPTVAGAPVLTPHRCWTRPGRGSRAGLDRQEQQSDSSPTGLVDGDRPSDHGAFGRRPTSPQPLWTLLPASMRPRRQSVNLLWWMQGAALHFTIKNQGSTGRDSIRPWSLGCGV